MREREHPNQAASQMQQEYASQFQSGEAPARTSSPWHSYGELDLRPLDSFYH